jgi:magnesium transporter
MDHAEGDHRRDLERHAPPPAVTEKTLDTGNSAQDEASAGNDFLTPQKHPIGVAAGVELQDLARRPTRQGSGVVTCIDYDPDNLLVQEIKDFTEFVEGHRPVWSKVRWINLRGLGDMRVIHALAEKYELHPLAVEDVLTGQQRPKVDDYPGSGEHPGRLFVVAKSVRATRHRLTSRQVSFFLGRNTLVTFQDSSQDAFDPVRRRIESKGSRLRTNDVSFLLYVLLDSMVDEFYPLLEEYAGRIERIERNVLAAPDRQTLESIHRMKRDLLMIRRVAWPMRELIRELTRERHECLSAEASTYLRDVHDHMLVIFELVQSHHDFVTTLTETYMSTVSNRMNEIMKTLTIISTIFVPLTFLAGVYGMNMPIPENQFGWTYPLFWLIAVIVSTMMLRWFKTKGWF